jgi:2-hydroxy-6-oxonona-2,4-dienedioate hydrolase
MSRFGYLRTPAPPHPSLGLQAEAHACLLDAVGVQSATSSAGPPVRHQHWSLALKYPQRLNALVLFVPGWYPPARRSFKRLGTLEALVFNRFLKSLDIY